MIFSGSKMPTKNRAFPSSKVVSTKTPLPKHYNEGQKHDIQLNNSQGLISPTISSHFQLGNSPELFFISTGRCQLDDFGDLPVGFVVGCP